MILSQLKISSNCGKGPEPEVKEWFWETVIVVVVVVYFAVDALFPQTTLGRILFLGLTEPLMCPYWSEHCLPGKEYEAHLKTSGTSSQIARIDIL